MKINGLLIISIIIVFLTIGAAGASDNVTEGDSVAAICENTSCDVLSDKFYYDGDVYASLKDNYAEDDWGQKELVYLASYDDKSGNFTVSVDNVEKLTVPLTEGYFSIEDDGHGGTYRQYVKNIYPTDLGLDCGNYSIQVNFNDKNIIDSQVSLKFKDDFDVFMQNPYYCEEEYLDSPSFLIIDSNHANSGTLEIYVNGTRKLNYTLTNGTFEVIDDYPYKSKYIAPSQLFAGYGDYNVKVTFTDDNGTVTLKDENVVFREFEPTIDPKLELYFDFYTLALPADNVAHIYLPREAKGNLTISFNDVKNAEVTYSKGQGSYYINAWQLNHLGENVITVNYTGDDFGTLTISEKIIVVPSITLPFIVSVGEEFTISMVTHEWVFGKFNVYEYIGDRKGKLLASNYIENRVSSVQLSSDVVGLNKFYLEFEYPGGDYPMVEEVHVIENSENITVHIPSEVEIGNDFNVTVKTPCYPFSYVYIAVDGVSEFFNIETGEVTKSISGLGKGSHKIHVEYNEGDFVDGRWIGDVYSKMFTVNVVEPTEIEFDDVVTCYSSNETFVVTLMDNKGNCLPDYPIYINLNGANLKDKITSNGKVIVIDDLSCNFTAVSDENGQVELMFDLCAGNYTAFFGFAGDENYMSSNRTSKITISKLPTSLNASDVEMIYSDSDNMIITLKDVNGKVLSEKLISVDIKHAADLPADAWSYNLTTDKNGVARLPIDLDAGSYVTAISFRGDVNYLANSTSAEIEVSKMSTGLSVQNITIAPISVGYLTVTLSDAYNHPLSDKTISISLNGIQYMNATDAMGQVKLPVSLDSGNYTSAISYDGDANYESSSATAYITVKKLGTVIIAPNISSTYNIAKNLLVTLKDSNGVALVGKHVIIKVAGKTYDRITNGNGQVSLSLILATKTYWAEISFADDNSFIGSSHKTKIVFAKATPKLTAKSKTFKVKTKTKKVTATLKDNKGKVMKKVKVTLKVNKKTYSAKTNSKGIVTFKVKLTKKGTFKAIYKFMGNSNYKSISKTLKIIIKK
ncbi:Ig-like domain-containing protein [Methanobrevibacter sp.]|uniref:Ig-like domain-containing protein n=1 Tax=Methanobrevibacter sp. TaxID=66852 RepID=UPI00388D3556